MTTASPAPSEKITQGAAPAPEKETDYSMMDDAAFAQHVKSLDASGKALSPDKEEPKPGGEEPKPGAGDVSRETTATEDPDAGKDPSDDPNKATDDALFEIDGMRYTRGEAIDRLKEYHQSKDALTSQLERARQLLQVASESAEEVANARKILQLAKENPQALLEKLAAPAGAPALDVIDPETGMVDPVKLATYIRTAVQEGVKAAKEEIPATIEAKQADKDLRNTLLFIDQTVGEFVKDKAFEGMEDDVVAMLGKRLQEDIKSKKLSRQTPHPKIRARIEEHVKQIKDRDAKRSAKQASSDVAEQAKVAESLPRGTAKPGATGSPRSPESSKFDYANATDDEFKEYLRKLGTPEGVDAAANQL